MKTDRAVNILANEATLLWYSLRMLIGRNLLAVVIISVVALGAVFSYSVTLGDTKWTVLLKQLEMFAPLLGIVIFSDLIAGDVEAKRSTLLMSSRYGIVPVVIRKLIHGLLITSATYVINLLVLRLFYTSFNIFSAFAVIVPGALYFGMIGLLAATFASRALAGYAAGTSALILSMVIPETMPLVPTAFALKSKLATATLFAESNWLFAKIAFVILAFVLAALVVVMAKKRSHRIHVVIAATLLLAGCYSVTHIIWSREVRPDLYFSNPGKQLDVIQNGDELIVRTAAVRIWGRGKNKSYEETSLTDTTYKSQNGQWIEQRQVEYDPSKEYDLVHLALLVTRLRKQQAKAGDITVTVFSHSMSDKYVRQIAERTCDALRYYETAFGKYPHRNLAVVEYDYISAGGVAVPSIVLMNTKRCRPEHKSDMLNMYVPHEVSHQWFSSGLPSWVAEASAVYSNYLYLAQGPNSQTNLSAFHKGLNETFETGKDYPAPLVGSAGLIPYIKGGYLLMMLTSVDKQRTIDSLGAFIADQLKRQLVDGDATAERFMEAMNNAGGADLASFVSDWAYTINRFDPAVTGFVQSKTTAGQYNVRASLANREQIRFPVPLRISFEDGTNYDATWNNLKENQTIEWTFERAVRSITLDPDNVLLDWNRFNNVRRAGAFVAGKTASPEPAAPAKKQTANWTTYTVADGLIDNNVRCLDIDSSGKLFAGFGLYTKEPGTVVNCFDGDWTQPDSLSASSGPVYAVTVTSDGTIWTGGSGRLRRIDEKGTTIFVLSQMRHYRSLTIGKARFEPNPQANSNIPGYIVYDLMTDGEGNIRLATDNGISVIDGAGKLVNHFGTDDGLPGNEVLCMARDGSGTLWIGTDKGPASYREDQWTTYSKCRAGIVLALATDPDGSVFLGTYRHGIIVYDGRSYRRYDSTNSRLPHNMVTALVYDKQGRLWAGTCQGLLCIDKDSQQVYTNENSSLLSNRIADLLADDEGIWVATDAGIAKRQFKNQR
ncbi:MAG: hypothetical protein ISS70_11770 [Phycisphaerae bacterium]|nr:hypothetical protein [Phycisphaerae bacterium]